MTDESIRTDLAAAYRLADLHGYNEGIFNHLTVLVPGESRFLVQPFGMHWSEVTASSLIEVDFEGSVAKGDGEVERSTVCIHVPIHRAYPHARCVFHTHMPFASTLTRLVDSRIAPTGQTELQFLRTVAYDDSYRGLVFDLEEGARLARFFAPETRVLMLANHGVVVIGSTVAETYDRLYYLEQACRSQVYAMWTGRALRELPTEVISNTLRHFADAPTYYGKRASDLHFAALKRILARRCPGFDDLPQGQ
jgi:ribulose-5-phosphate 4-epimerase/fuculose-1-phosphate aldolase